MDTHSADQCVCDYGEICQAHGKVEVTTKIIGAVPRLDRSKLSPEILDIIERMEESVRQFKENIRKTL